MRDEIPGHIAGYRPLTARTTDYEPRAVWRGEPSVWPTQTGARRDLARLAAQQREARDEARRTSGLVAYFLPAALLLATAFGIAGWWVVGNWAMLAGAWPWR